MESETRLVMIDHGLPHAAEANEGKFLAAEAGFHAADVAISVHGGYGYATTSFTLNKAATVVAANCFCQLSERPNHNTP